MKTLIVAELAEMDPAAVEVAVGQKMNRIQVSAFKKRTYFYVKLAKRRMRDYNEVELSGLGMAVGTVVKVAEILKNKGYATLKKILTSTIDSTNVKNGRIVRKSKIEILLEKTENLLTSTIDSTNVKNGCIVRKSKSITRWQAKVSRLVSISSVS